MGLSMSTDGKKHILRKTRNLKQKKLAEIAPEQPKDMLDVVALRKMLDNLTDSYQETVASQEETEKHYLFRIIKCCACFTYCSFKNLTIPKLLINDSRCAI